ncbi:50S ribosomal protein L25 [Conexibacter sp. W3-3-2]|uniref:Large ribosomal subunit protein bL25 n=1 Tax=Paraconexibacter algicola TaxID=2133960 RepID=A0A2T4ULT7_9ACTN|nr:MULTISPECIES: 50S ribosomal protein L25 [Solirubrobacterales]MTD46559.1 50S ribosomal protein L25 [Conexibacter sp. W3-3-2]PTL60199.1 50S ribosomal protein L25 [Paraconexibacter algicola]
MAKTEATKLDVSSRTPGHSRETRRLRREGLVPGVVYGGGEDPVSFQIGARDLRLALATTGAVFEVVVDGGSAVPAILKDAQRHPVRGEIMHVDFLRVDLNKPIQAPVLVELVGGDDAPGVVEGGILTQVVSELNVEARPADIPDVITVDVSAMVEGDTLLLSAIEAPAGVTLLDDPEETVLATIVAPAVVETDDEIEGETEVIGEGGDDAEGSEEDGEDAGSEDGGDDAGE